MAVVLGETLLPAAGFLFPFAGFHIRQQMQKARFRAVFGADLFELLPFIHRCMDLEQAAGPPGPGMERRFRTVSRSTHSFIAQCSRRASTVAQNIHT